MFLDNKKIANTQYCTSLVAYLTSLHTNGLSSLWTKSFVTVHRRALPLYLVRTHWIHPLKRHNFISLRGQRLPLTSHALPLSTSWKSLVVCWNTWSACGVLSGGAVTLLSNVLLFEQTRMFCKRFLNFGIYLFWLYQNRRLARTVRFF